MRGLWLLPALLIAGVLNRLLHRGARADRDSVLLRFRDQAHGAEGLVRHAVRSGRYGTIYVQDGGSRDETAAILERLADELGLMWLPPGAEVPGGTVLCEWTDGPRRQATDEPPWADQDL